MLLYTPLIAVLVLYALWVFYLAVMNLKRARDADKLGRVAYILAMPVLGIGLLLDLVANVAVMTIVLLEPPRELTVTARLQRHKRESTGWRLRVAQWFASELLDAFDPSGVHV